MTHEEALLHLTQTHAYQRGHFLLKNGKHTDTYIECAHLTENVEETRAICVALSDMCRESGATVAIGLAVGGLILAYETAATLKLRFIYAEKKDGVMTLRRDFSILPNDRVLIIEDIVKTGDSVREVIELVRACGGTVAMVGALCHRGNPHMDFGVPYKHLLDVHMNIWEAQACPLCRKELGFDKPLGRRT